MQAVIEEQSWHGLNGLERGLRRFLARHCPDENVVDDIIQETFVRAAHYRANLADTGRLRPWVNRIALNVLADFRRRGRRYVFTPMGDPSWESLEEARIEEAPPRYHVGRWTLAHDDVLEHLAGELPRLCAEDRAVLGSYYGGRGSCRETARECGIPLHLVKVRLFRARRRLVRAIERRLAANHVQGFATEVVA